MRGIYLLTTYLHVRPPKLDLERGPDLNILKETSKCTEWISVVTLQDLEIRLLRNRAMSALGTRHRAFSHCKTYTCRQAEAPIDAYIHIHAYIHTQVHTHTYIYIHTHTHTRTDKQTQMGWQSDRFWYINCKFGHLVIFTYTHAHIDSDSSKIQTPENTKMPQTTTNLMCQMPRALKP